MSCLPLFLTPYPFDLFSSLMHWSEHTHCFLLEATPPVSWAGLTVELKITSNSLLHRTGVQHEAWCCVALGLLQAKQILRPQTVCAVWSHLGWDLAGQPWLAWNSVRQATWPPIFGDPLASASQCWDDTHTTPLTHLHEERVLILLVMYWILVSFKKKKVFFLKKKKKSHWFFFNGLIW